MLLTFSPFISVNRFAFRCDWELRTELVVFLLSISSMLMRKEATFAYIVVVGSIQSMCLISSVCSVCLISVESLRASERVVVYC